KTKLRSEIVTLYQGGQYHLYRYKEYTDVRLVFAPEQQIAFYGGDPDNFEYPRFDLDMCIFRVYEDGKPAKIEHFLKWSEGGAKKKLREAVAQHSDLKDAVDAWDRISTAQAAIGKVALRYNMLEAGRGFNSQLFGIARTLLRAGEEKPKPNAERLREFRDSNL